MGYTHKPEPTKTLHDCRQPVEEVVPLTRWKCDECGQEWVFKYYGYWDRYWPKSKTPYKVLFWIVIPFIALFVWTLLF